MKKGRKRQKPKKKQRRRVRKQKKRTLKQRKRRIRKKRRVLKQKRRVLKQKKRRATRKRKGRYRVLFEGSVKYPRKGYYILIHALVPGSWAIYGASFYDEDPDAEPYQIVIWRTRVHRTIKETLKWYKQLITDQSAYSEVSGIPYLLLTTELYVIYTDLHSERMAMWSGLEIPKKYKRYSEDD